jgi:hypothetical protein
LQNIDAAGKVSYLQWGINFIKLGMSNLNLIIKLENTFSIVYEQNLSTLVYGMDLLLTQTGAKTVSIKNRKSFNHNFDYPQQIKKLLIARQTMAIWNGVALDVYSFAHEEVIPKNVGTLQCENDLIGLSRMIAVSIVQGTLQILNLKNLSQSSLLISKDGEIPISLCCSDSFIFLVKSD